MTYIDKQEGPAYFFETKRTASNGPVVIDPCIGKTSCDSTDIIGHFFSKAGADWRIKINFQYAGAIN